LLVQGAVFHVPFRQYKSQCSVGAITMAIPTKQEILSKINELKAEKDKLEKELDSKLKECREMRRQSEELQQKINGSWATYQKFYGGKHE